MKKILSSITWGTVVIRPYIILYIAMSIDGFIADKQGGVDWLPQEVPAGQDDSGFEKFLTTIDVIAQGSRTFFQTISFIDSGLVSDLPYGGKHMYVFTRQQHTTDRTDVTFVKSIDEFLAIMQQLSAVQRIWLLGGAELIAAFKARDLIDECIVTVVPQKLSEGIALPTTTLVSMEEVASRTLWEGMVEKRYIRAKRLIVQN